MKVTEIVAKLAEPVVKQFGCELWDVEYVREGDQRFLRLYLDKESGVDITDCENISMLRNDERPTIVWQFFRFGENAETRLELAKFKLFKQIVVVDNGCFQPRGRTQPVMEIGVSVDDLRQPNAATGNADVRIAESGITKTE